MHGGWTAGPDAAGANTYVGRIEAPRAGQSVAGGAKLLVSGWAADTTAEGWSGFDQVQVYDGARDQGGTKLADGMVGLNRPDVADALGSNFAHSGFSAVIPAGGLATGPQTLYVYLHTGAKGWWYKTVAVRQQPPAAQLQFPSDPVVTILRPTDGVTITNQQFGAVDNYLITGFALDRNPQMNPNGLPKTNVPNGGPGNVGIARVTLYIDKLPGEPGYDPDVNLIGQTSPDVIALGSTDTPLNHNVFQNGCSVFGGPVTMCRADISVTKSYGPDYTFAGFVKYWDQRTVQPDMFHTIYAVAVSSITGKSSTASTSVYVKSLPASTPGCGLAQLVKHQCAYLAP
jgi:hypothetical protein